MASLSMEQEVTALHLINEYVILGTVQGSLHIRDLYRYVPFTVSYLNWITVQCSVWRTSFLCLAVWMLLSRPWP